MANFKNAFLLDEEEKKYISELCGKIMLYVLEGRSIAYMSDELNLHPAAVTNNIDEMLYCLMKQVGRKKSLEMLFRK